MGSFATRPVVRMLRARGEPMTLRRQLTANPQTFQDVQVMGSRRAPPGTMATQLPGAASQTPVQVMISNAEIAAASWPGPPRKDDRLVMEGRVYTLMADADTRRDRGDIVAHFLMVKGGP